MKLLAVASLIFSLCQVRNKGHRRGPQTTTATTTTTTTTTTATAITTTTTKGPPPKCSKSSCDKIDRIGLNPFRDFPALILHDLSLIDPRVRYAYNKWRVSNKSLWDPTKNCTIKPIDILGGLQVGLSKSNEIVHVFGVEMSHFCISKEKDCEEIRGRRGRMYGGKCIYNSKNLITINQSGEVIDDKINDGCYGCNWDAYADISCLSC